MSNTINPTGLFLASALTAAGQLIHGWHPSALVLSICLCAIVTVLIAHFIGHDVTGGLLGLVMLAAVFAMPWLVV